MKLPSAEGLPHPKIEPRSPTWQADSLPSEPPGKPQLAGDSEAKALPQTALQKERRYKAEGRDFPGGPRVKNPPHDAEDVGSLPRSEN